MTHWRSAGMSNLASVTAQPKAASARATVSVPSESSNTKASDSAAMAPAANPPRPSVIAGEESAARRALNLSATNPITKLRARAVAAKALLVSKLVRRR